MFEYIKEFFALIGLACFVVTSALVSCALLSKAFKADRSDAGL